MRIIRFNGVSNSLKLEPESVEDLYVLAIIISKNDAVESKTSRRFRPTEGDKGEQKDVIIKISVESSEIDKNSGRLRLLGKILSGKPEEFVTLGSYHTLNIGAGDIIDIQKEEWKEYVLKRIKQAVVESRKPRLGIVVLDDEKALVSYIKGYGIEIISELYSRLSKRMKEKDYQKQRDEYFKDVINSINNMNVDIVVVAGPGFTKDDIKKYMSDMGIEISKQIAYCPASDAERSGIREVMQSPVVGKILENEHVKKEFEYLNRLLNGMRSGTACHGMDDVIRRLEKGGISIILVNDNMINEASTKDLLDKADKTGVKIEIFSSDDDAGVQLRNLGGIAGIV